MTTDLVCTPEEFLAAEPAERAKLVLAQIDLVPEQWNQSVWAVRTECGTSACFAGWTCLLAGAEFTQVKTDAGDGMLEYQGQTRHPADLAEELLGFKEALQTYWDGPWELPTPPEEKLFDADNTRDKIVELLDKIYE